MIDCLIFSKDRACQLHLLLDSLAANAPGLFSEIGILYKATTKESYEAYELLHAEGHEVGWYNEDWQAQCSTP